jgi:UDP-2,3-diacylglucosamine pyrophosphatase LpxH
MKKTALKFRTIILSDVHLGTVDCKAEEVCHFLKHTHCDKLILNGDIIDGWSLKRKGGWKKKHTRFIRYVLKKMEKKRTEVIYLRGNHDDILAQFLPFELDRLRVVEDYIHETPDRRYLCIHGDVFDAVTVNHRFLAVIGDVGYQWLLRLNRLYNHYRSWRGKPYFSLSKAIKARVKQAVSHVSRFEDVLQEFAARKGCDGIICGHIHTPDDKMIGTVHYLNSGDWVESLTAIVEHFDGTMEVLGYDEFRERLDAKASRDHPEISLVEQTGIEDEEVEEAGIQVAPQAMAFRAGMS